MSRRRKRNAQGAATDDENVNESGEQQLGAEGDDEAGDEGADESGDETDESGDDASDDADDEGDGDDDQGGDKDDGDDAADQGATEEEVVAAAPAHGTMEAAHAHIADLPDHPDGSSRGKILDRPFLKSGASG
jgi:hypothetical protein